MGIPVMIMGESGSGKSASLRNFEPDEIGIFSVASKPLPFRKKLPQANGATYNSIMKSLGKASRKAYAIDDSQYLMTFDSFKRAKERGYEKYTDFAIGFYNLIQFAIGRTPPDCIVYFLHHTYLDPATGKTRIKTVGKMLDEKLTLEGLFSIVLMTEITDDGYSFVTQSDGFSTCKSPMGMFPPRMENDLKLVDKTIREYYNMPPIVPDKDTPEVGQNENAG